MFNQLAMEMFQLMRAQGRGGKSQMDCVNYLAELARAARERSVAGKA